MPLLLRPQPLEALYELVDRRWLRRPGETRRETVLAPYHGVLTVGIVGPLEAFEGDLEVGNCVGTGMKLLGLDAASRIAPMRCTKVAAGGAHGGRAHRHEEAIAQRAVDDAEAPPRWREHPEGEAVPIASDGKWAL